MRHLVCCWQIHGQIFSAYICKVSLDVFIISYISKYIQYVVSNLVDSIQNFFLKVLEEFSIHFLLDMCTWMNSDWMARFEKLYLLHIVYWMNKDLILQYTNSLLHLRPAAKSTKTLIKASWSRRRIVHFLYCFHAVVWKKSPL